MNLKMLRKPKPEKKTSIRLAGIIEESIVDGPGMRFVVFVQGCPHNCPGCHNPETHEQSGGALADIEKLADKIAKSACDGVTFSGGEPFEQASELAYLAERIREKRKGRKTHFISYSGYEYEELLDRSNIDDGVFNLLCAVNYLIDGRYIEDRKDYTSFYRGSGNQKIYDVTCFPNSTDAKEIKKISEMKI